MRRSAPAGPSTVMLRQSSGLIQPRGSQHGFTDESFAAIVNAGNTGEVMDAKAAAAMSAWAARVASGQEQVTQDQSDLRTLARELAGIAAAKVRGPLLPCLPVSLLVLGFGATCVNAPVHIWMAIVLNQVCCGGLSIRTFCWQRSVTVHASTHQGGYLVGKGNAGLRVNEGTDSPNFENTGAPSRLAANTEHGLRIPTCM